MTDPFSSAALVAVGTAALSTFGQSSMEMATKEFWKRLGEACGVIRLKLKLTDDNPFDDPELLAQIVDHSCQDEVIQKSLKSLGEEVKASANEKFMISNRELIEFLQKRIASQSQTQGKNVFSGKVNNPSQSPITVGDGNLINNGTINFGVSDI